MTRVLDFLKDHWPYNINDLERLLDLAFKWKNEDEDGREVLLLGGDIHCGVTSVIRFLSKSENTASDKIVNWVSFHDRDDFQGQ